MGAPKIDGCERRSTSVNFILFYGSLLLPLATLSSSLLLFHVKNHDYSQGLAVLPLFRFFRGVCVTKSLLLLSHSYSSVYNTNKQAAKHNT